MLTDFRADLHIHTCLSACADLSMTPRGVAERAAALGIGLIAVCDHNSSENVGVTRDIAEKLGVLVIPGMEICSSEEVHVLGLFGDISGSQRMQDAVYDNLQPGENIEDVFGMQVVVNEHDEVLGFNRRLLSSATNLSVEEIVGLIHDFNGLAVASHIDREGFGVIGQLGFVPPGLKFDALEISYRMSRDMALGMFRQYSHIPWISSSDAHHADDIGRRTTSLSMHAATFEELALSLKGLDNRRVSF